MAGDEQQMPANIPRYAMYRGHKVRVMAYYGGDRFLLLDQNDTERLVGRGQFTFIPEKKKS